MATQRLPHRLQTLPAAPPNLANAATAAHLAEARKMAAGVVVAAIVQNEAKVAQNATIAQNAPTNPMRATVNAPKAAPAETLVVNAQSAPAKSPVWMKVASQTPQPNPLKQQTTPTATDRRAKAVNAVTADAPVRAVASVLRQPLPLRQIPKRKKRFTPQNPTSLQPWSSVQTMRNLCRLKASVAMNGANAEAASAQAVNAKPEPVSLTMPATCRPQKAALHLSTLNRRTHQHPWLPPNPCPRSVRSHCPWCSCNRWRSPAVWNGSIPTPSAWP